MLQNLNEILAVANLVVQLPGAIESLAGLIDKQDVDDETHEALTSVSSSAAGLKKTLQFMGFVKQAHQDFSDIRGKVIDLHDECADRDLGPASWGRLVDKWKTPDRHEISYMKRSLEIGIWPIVRSIEASGRADRIESTDITVVAMQTALEGLIQSRHDWPKAFDRCDTLFRKPYDLEVKDKLTEALNHLWDRTEHAVDCSNALLIGYIQLLTARAEE